MQVTEYSLESMLRGFQIACVVLGVCWVWVYHRKRLRIESEASESIIVDATNDGEYDPILTLPTIDYDCFTQYIYYCPQYDQFELYDSFNGSRFIEMLSERKFYYFYIGEL